jgi:hypothetical protein
MKEGSESQEIRHIAHIKHELSALYLTTTDFVTHFLCSSISNTNFLINFSDLKASAINPCDRLTISTTQRRLKHNGVTSWICKVGRRLSICSIYSVGKLTIPTQWHETSVLCATAFVSGETRQDKTGVDWLISAPWCLGLRWEIQGLEWVGIWGPGPGGSVLGVGSQ